ncbi:MAG: type II secretion system F family protein [bacterium]|nr:type II secretion system F family protein [bacterium]
MEGLSINYINTNEDVIVTYTPSSNVLRYSYTIIKDNEYKDIVNVEGTKSSDILLNETGIYKLEITYIDNLNHENKIVSGEYKIDKEAPILNIENKTYKIKCSENFNYLDGVSAYDNVDGDLTGNIKTNISNLDLSTNGVKELVYEVQDSAGNTVSTKAYITVKSDNTSVVRLGQLTLTLVVVLVLIFLFRYIRSIKLEKRFSKYTINSSKNKSISLFDNIYNKYICFVDTFTKFLSKSAFLTKRSKRYDKYSDIFDKNTNGIVFISKKILLGFIYIVFAIIIRLLQSKLLAPLEMIIPFILGYITLDIIYFNKYINYKKKIKKDMLEAITIMNNAFKAGMSITQAVLLVSEQLNGPISIEFKKIHMEISLGLDINVAFKRFADRVNLDEAKYLASSLSVLNKTGGNIIKVFNSIEKNTFNRKKLEEELKALTSSSKMVMYVLTIVPILFVLFINLINKDYFNVLFTNIFGLVIIFVIVIMYISYIFIVRRVMKIGGIK